MELGTWSIYIIIGILTVIFTFAVYTGIEKGVKLIGDINMWVFVGVWFFVLIFGPTIFLINLTTNAVGQYLLYFLPMSLYTAPGVEGNWIGSWTFLLFASGSYKLHSMHQIYISCAVRQSKKRI